MDPERIDSAMLTPELIEREGRALRALAAHLLDDRHAAEDVVQDAWLASLAAPLSLLRAPSAWLAAVTRNLASKKRREAGRRREREARVARAAHVERVDAGELAGERAATLAAVTAAVLALEEPYKTTILLRYFEGLTPSTIASRAAVPLPTVKSRLARGLERLRLRLDATLGQGGADWKDSLALLVGLPLPRPPLDPSVALPTAATSPIALGTLAMTTKTKLALAAGGLLTALLWIQLAGEPAAPTPALPAQLRDAAVLSGAEASLVASGLTGGESRAQDGRASIQEEAPVERALVQAPAFATPFDYRIDFAVVDEEDLPLAGAEVWLAPRGHALNLCGATGSHGLLSIYLRGTAAMLDLVLAVREENNAFNGLRSITVVAGAVNSIGVQVRDREMSTRFVRFTPASDEEAGTFALALQAEPGEQGDLVFQLAVANYSGNEDFAEPLSSAPELIRDEDGIGWFVEEREVEHCPAPEIALADEALVALSTGTALRDFVAFSNNELLLAHEVSRLQDFQVVFDRGMLRSLYVDLQGSEVTLDVAPAEVLTTRLSGVIRDAFGAPVPNALIVVGTESQPQVQSTRAEDDGSYALEDLPAEPLFVRAGGRDDGLAFETLAVKSGAETLWDPRLERGAEVLGRVVDEAGAPRVGIALELVDAGDAPRSEDWTLSSPEGLFSLANVPSGAKRLFVHAPGAVEAFPALIVEAVYPGSDLGSIALPAPATALGSVRVEVLSPLGEPLQDAEVRLWHEASGRGAFLAPIEACDEAPAQHGLDGIPAGAYRLEVGHPRFGWLQAGEVWLEPGAQLDLGKVVFDEPALVSATFAQGTEKDLPELALELWRSIGGAVSRTATLDEPATRVLALPSGTYCVLARTQGGVAGLDLAPRASGRAGFELAIDAGGKPSLSAAPFRAGAPYGPLEQSCETCHPGTVR